MSAWSKNLMRVLAVAAVAAVAVPMAACNGDNGNQMMFVNPSTVRVTNNLAGPVLFFRVRACGTTNWGNDLLPNDPVNGRINPGNSRDFTVEAGCYDLQAQHLPDDQGPGQLVTKEIMNQIASPVAILTWELTEAPGGPN